MRLKIYGLRNFKVFLHKRNEGGTIIEVALLAPLFFALLLGLLDFGLLMTRWVLVENAINQASRTGIVNPVLNMETEITEKTFGLVKFDDSQGNCIRIRSFSSISALNHANTLPNCQSACPQCSSTAGNQGNYVLYQVIFTHSFITPIGTLINLASGNRNNSTMNAITFRTSTVLRNESV
jgi:Flp pilus assembly protein TadG